MPTGLPAGVSTDHQEWVLDFCGVRKAWAIPPKPGGKAKGEGIYIAHPDTGATDHPELPAPRYVRDPAISKNFYDYRVNKRAVRDLPEEKWPDAFPSNDPLKGPFPSHGTATASVIMSGQGHPNGTSEPQKAKFNANTPEAFVSGIAPMANLIPFRVTNNVILDDKSDQALVAAIDFCLALKKRDPPIDIAVMSVSLGRLKLSIDKKVYQALERARRGGIVICAAAGQLVRGLGVFNPTFPSSDENVIGVGACGADHSRLPGGFYGSTIDISSPGMNIWRAYSVLKKGKDPGPPDFLVAQSEGTSHATAITSGTCALWQAHHGRANLLGTYGPENITPLFKYCLQKTADTRGGTWDTAKRGAGVIDVEALLNFTLPARSVIEAL